MRSVPGQAFSFDWNVVEGPYGTDPGAAYPGDAYVDEVGVDLYDQSWELGSSPMNRSTSTSSQRAWNAFLADSGTGLDRMVRFANAHHKPLSLPEWGVIKRPDGHGLGDDPMFVDNVATWIANHHVAFSSYFSFDSSRDGQSDITSGTFPLALARFEQRFR
jgi:hypothetical protein